MDRVELWFWELKDELTGMWRRMKYIPIFVVFALAACSSTGVVPMDGDTYMIAQRSAQVGSGPPLAVQAEVYQEANAFCAREKKQVETIKLDMVNSGFARPGSVSLQFRCK